MITNHGYLDNPTFRGMRQSLMHTFDEIYVLDLHGNTKKNETSPDGSKDENVFDIQQGTAIILMLKTGLPGLQTSLSAQADEPLGGAAEICSTSTRGHVESTPIVKHHELFGLRQIKYDWLDNDQFQAKIHQELSPTSPFYLFRPDATGNEHYLQCTSLLEIFPINSVGIVTARDGLTIQDTPNQVRKTIHHFASLDLEIARVTYQLGKDARDWKVEYAQKDLKDSGISDNNIVPILYRPFDSRYTYYTGKSKGFHCMPRNEVMRQMREENVGMVIGRQGLAVGDNQLCNLVTISQSITDFNLFLSWRWLDNPLYIYPDEHIRDNLPARSGNTTSLQSF